MRTSGNTVLITGGGTGIGLELARAFLQKGNTVLICGCRPEKLAEAKAQLPSLHVYACDVGEAAQRRNLVDFCMKNFPALNVLVNNAGIQREIDFRGGEAAYLEGDSEVRINLEAPLHLIALFTPHLMGQPEAAIINVSSGLALVPLEIMPVYCATKAALHSFSITLRQQLKGTSVKVFELMPPVVDTDLDKGARTRRGQTARGIAPEKVAADAMTALEANRYEVAVGLVKALRIGARLAPAFFYQRLNARAKK